MQVISSILDLQNELSKMKLDRKSFYTFAFYENEIVLYKNGGEFISNYTNNTNIMNLELYFDYITVITNILKAFKVNQFNYEIKEVYFEATEDKKETYKTCFSIEVLNNSYNFPVNHLQYSLEYFKTEFIDYSNLEYLGKLTKTEIMKFINIMKYSKVDDFRNFTSQIYISENKFYITDSYYVINDAINLKDCYLKLDNLQKLTKYENIEIYKNDKFVFYKTETLNLKSEFSENEYNFVNHVKRLLNENKKFNNEFILDFTEVYKLKNSKYQFIYFNFLDNSFTLSKDYELDENSVLISKKLQVHNKELENDYSKFYVRFQLKNIINLLNNIENKDCVKLQTKKDGYSWLFDNYIIIENSNVNLNNLEIIKKIKINTENETSLESKQAAPVTKQKSMKKDKPNLKIEKTVKVLKSKYSEVKNEVVEVVNEVENEVTNEVKILDAAPENKENIKEIRPKNIKKLTPAKAKKEVKKVEVSNTIVDDNFDFMEFIFIHCITDLEKLEFHNLNYKQKRLYLEDFEFTFNEINSNQIEVIELTANNESKIHNLSKKEVLQLIRNRVEECI